MKIKRLMEFLNKSKADEQEKNVVIEIDDPDLAKPRYYDIDMVLIRYSDKFDGDFVIRASKKFF